MIVAALIILAIIVGISTTAAFWVNWWWFGSVGYQSVLTTRYLAGALAFVAGGAVATAFFVVNWQLALRRSQLLADRSSPRGNPAAGTGRFVRGLLWLLSAALFVLVGVGAAGDWQTWLLWLRGGSFGRADPIFGRDVGFYVFTLPALTTLQQAAIPLVLATGAIVIVVYALRLGLSRSDLRRPPLPVRTHVLALAGVLLLVFGAAYLLDNFRLLYSTRGVVFGASFTDVTIDRWANYTQAAISVVAAVLLLLNARVRRLRWLVLAFAAWAVVAVVGEIVPAAVQQTVVEPSELARERPYIENNIELTQLAFGLDGVETAELSGQGEPPPSALSPTSPTFDNIRLWDYRVIQSTYQVLYSFRPYYQFQDVDVDRYLLDGRLRQVLLSARELDPDGLPTQAQTWVNRHLAYTHGYRRRRQPDQRGGRAGAPDHAGQLDPARGDRRA